MTAAKTRCWAPRDINNPTDIVIRELSRFRLAWDSLILYYFGFMSLVLGERRTATTVARGFCDLLILKSDDFNRIKAEFPEFHDVLRRASAERAEKISQLILEGVVL